MKNSTEMQISASDIEAEMMLTNIGKVVKTLKLKFELGIF